MKSIGMRFTAIMLCVVLVGISVTVGTALYVMSNAITEETLAKVRYETESEASGMNSWLGAQKANITTLSDVLSGLEVFSEEQLVEVFRPVLAENPAYYDVYMGYPSGLATSGIGDEFDYSWWQAYERDWYVLAMSDTTRTHITSPYTDAITGSLCLTVCRAVYRDGELAGVIAADVLVTTLYDMTLAVTLEAKGFAMLLDAGGDILVHPDDAFAPADEQFQNLSSAADGAYSGLWDKMDGKDGVYKYEDTAGVVNYYTAVTLDVSGWRVVSVLPESVVNQPIRTAVLTVVPIAAVILLLTALIIFVITRSEITAPIRNLAAAANRLAAGSVTIAVGKKRDDEIGSLTDAFIHMVESVREQTILIQHLADGDLTVDIQPRSDEDTIGHSLVKLRTGLNAMMGDIQESIRQVTQGSRQITDSSQIVAQGSSEQSTSIERLGTRIIELSGSIQKNAERAERAAALSGSVKDNAETGNTQMNNMLLAVEEISEASRSIQRVIKVIDDIAFQTNILALNASVEAARAGQHGKGFAVVAAEVRSLAAKSAEAAKDTGSLITNSMEKAALGARIAEETSASLRGIVEGISQSALLVNEIALSGGEQAVSVNEIRDGVSRVSQVVQQNSASAQESAAASEEMSSQAHTLEDLVSRFKVDGGSLPPSGTRFLGGRR